MAIHHSEKWELAYGDPNEASVGVTKATFERIMKTCGRHRADALALYLFYAYTARWQHTTNEIWATTRYACDGLGWGKDKLTAVKKQLMALGLIENIMVRDEGGRLTRKGWRIRVNYIVGKWVHDESMVDPLGRPDSDQILILRHVGKSEPKEDLLLDEKYPVSSNTKRESLIVKFLNEQAEQIWKAYPRKAGKPAAIRAIQAALKREGINSFDRILAATKAFARVRPDPNDHFTPWPQKFFNQERYNDDPATWSPAPKPLTAVERNKRKGKLQEDLNIMFRMAKDRQRPGQPLYTEAEQQQRSRIKKEIEQL